MKIKFMLKRATILTVFVFTLSALSPLTSFAEPNQVKDPVLEGVLASETVEGIDTTVKLDDSVLSKSFDLEEEVMNLPSINEMTNKEKKLFYQIVDEQTELSGVDEKELFKEALVDFFDENSETYQDLTGVQSELEKEMESLDNNQNDFSDNQFATIKNTFSDMIGIKETQAAWKIGLSVRVTGAIINTAIGIAVGGGVGAIQSFIISKGKKEAQKIFTRTVTSKLKAWGAKHLATAVGVSVAFALNYLDIGTQIAKQLDKRDKRPNNGWVDIY
ncbi:hypothetical protein [Bacillus xiamenensis]|nr:hypothetical protein [Bacillus xiamenensis]